jgi:hypothetical protein
MANPFVEGSNSASPQSIYSTYTTQEHALGSRGKMGDRTFRYVRFLDSTAIGPNKLVQMAPPVPNHVTQTVTLTASGLDVVGSTQLTLASVGATAVQENEYLDGYVKVQSSTLGPGQIYKIRSHAYVAASGTVTLNLYDPVVTACTGTLIVTLLHNPWSHVVISPTTITAPAAGVNLVNFAAATTASSATAGYLQTGTATWTQPRYGWVQSRGVSSCLIDTSDMVAGSGMIQSGATAGALGVAVETDIKQRIAMAMETITTNSIYASVFLQID